MGRGGVGDEPKEGWQRVYFNGRAFQEKMDLGGVSLRISGKPEGTTSVPGEREQLTVFCCSAEDSDGGSALLLVTSSWTLQT